MESIEIRKINVRGRTRKEMGNVRALADSIQRLGLLHPVVVTPENKLVVGRRRIEAFKILGKTTIPANVASNLQELELLLEAERDENTCRLDLVPEEGVLLGQRIIEARRPLAEEARREGNRRGGGDRRSQNRSPANCRRPNRDESAHVKEQAARAAGMSRRTYEKAEAVVKSGDRELIDEMNRTSNVDAAYKKHKKKQTEEARQEAAKQSSKLINQNIIHGDFCSVLPDLPANSIDLIFTDPPYDKESIGLYASLAEQSQRVLKPGGSLLAYVGHYAIHQIINSMEPFLRYWWLMCVKHGGPSSRLPGKFVFVGWKPIVWFVKGKRRDNEYISDMVQSEYEGKDDHDWKQSTKEASYFIEHLTKPNELVLDPMCGSGTTCLAAKLLNRRYLGVEIERDRATIAIKNLIEEVVDGQD